MVRAKRADGKAALSALQMAQEKWRANHVTYSNALDNTGLNIGTTSPDGHYTIAISGTPTATTYTATATPRDFTDSKCGTFAVNQDGKLTTGYASLDCWNK
ncbi:MAG: type IV pilin protein [Methylococcaceae bacterium]|nr:type IV pilin protein [Methylococcaceae bacterium]